MESLSLITTLAVVAVALVGLAKGLDVRLVLLIAAVVIGTLAGDLRPVLRTFLDTFSSEKFVIPLCSAMGFAYVLKFTGCDAQLVNVLLGPVKRMRGLLIPGVVLAGFLVNIPIVSQCSTAACLGTVVVPLMRSAGFSSLTIGSTLLLGSSVGGELLNPSAIELLAVHNKTGTKMQELCWGIVPPLLFPVVLISTVWFWWISRKTIEVPSTTDAVASSAGRANYFQAIVPLVPLIVLFLGGPPFHWLAIPPDWMAVKSADLPNPERVLNSRLIGVAMLVGVAAAALCTPRKASGCMKAFFDGVGYGFTNVVSLIVIAQCFGTALSEVGIAGELGNWIRQFPQLLEPLAAILPCLFGVLCGSGIASSQSLYQFFHEPALAVGKSPDEIGALVSMGASIGRTLSPVSAVGLLCGTLTGVKVMDLTKRLVLPLLAGLTVTMILHLLHFGVEIRALGERILHADGAMTLSAEALATMPESYLITVAIELSVLWFLLSKRHPAKVKVFAGFWLTACTYPVLWLVLPPFFDTRWVYLLVGETFVPVAECLLFWLLFIRGKPGNRRDTIRDLVAITLANLASFGFGLLLEVLF